MGPPRRGDGIIAPCPVMHHFRPVHPDIALLLQSVQDGIEHGNRKAVSALFLHGLGYLIAVHHPVPEQAQHHQRTGRPLIVRYKIVSGFSQDASSFFPFYHNKNIFNILYFIYI